MKPIRVLLADDHALVRSGIRALAEAIDGVQVVAEAVDGREALHLIETHHPDVVLMDISMAALNGLEAAARIARHHPATRVLMLSAHANEEYVGQALRSGAAGYLLKDSSPVELDLAIRTVARGETYVSAAVSRPVAADYAGRTGSEAGALGALTSRQREILQLVAEGKTTKQIARMLQISVKTVETHRAQLMDRLGIHEVAGLVRLAIRAGLVTADC
jgi:DNA-binding NarL/FixJ family response regulator